MLRFVFSFLILTLGAALAGEPGLTLSHDGHWLSISGAAIPGGDLKINYLEAYCRANSTDADWVKHTVIPHKPKSSRCRMTARC